MTASELPEKRYEQDCPCCVYLGHHEEYDLYFCNGGFDTTVIARFGEDGDYLSGLPFIYENPLREAAQRAIALGMLSLSDKTGATGANKAETVGECLNYTSS